MIYLDCACTVETPRSNGVPSCPFCAPRMVHRLSLAALLVALRAVRGAAMRRRCGVGAVVIRDARRDTKNKR